MPLQPSQPITRRTVPAQGRGHELIVFYDGTCGLCHTLVRFLLHRDPEARFRFSPLQGELAARTLKPEQLRDLDSMVLIRDGKVLEKADAALACCTELGGLWRLAGALRVLPKALRDWGYGVVARHRHRWPPGQGNCRLPSQEERTRFLP